MHKSLVELAGIQTGFGFDSKQQAHFEVDQVRISIFDLGHWATWGDAEAQQNHQRVHLRIY